MESGSSDCYVRVLTAVSSLIFLLPLVSYFLRQYSLRSSSAALLRLVSSLSLSSPLPSFLSSSPFLSFLSSSPPLPLLLLSFSRLFSHLPSSSLPHPFFLALPFLPTVTGSIPDRVVLNPAANLTLERRQHVVVLAVAPVPVLQRLTAWDLQQRLPGLLGPRVAPPRDLRVGQLGGSGGLGELRFEGASADANGAVSGVIRSAYHAISSLFFFQWSFFLSVSVMSLIHRHALRRRISLIAAQWLSPTRNEGS